MRGFDVLGDPVRRRILELLAGGELSAGSVTDTVRAEFGISQPAVSQHLRVLRDAGFATVRAAGARRFYSVRAEPLREIDAWLRRFPGVGAGDGPTPARVLPGPAGRLDALDTELRRGRRRPTPIGDADDDRSAG